jgi:hypothetical protein
MNGNKNDEFLVLAGANKSTKECEGDRRVDPKNDIDSLPELLKRESVEIYAKALVRTFLFGTQTLELRVPGYVKSALRLEVKPVPPPESCSVNGNPYPNDLTFTRYKAASVTCAPCTSEIRRCVDGKLSGSFTATSCNSLPCNSSKPPSRTKNPEKTRR